jgi:hypothetical protein
MLIGSQSEFSLVYLCDLPQGSLEFATGFILYAAVFDETGEMMLAIPTGLPAKVIDITVESVWTGWSEAEAEKFLYLRSEGIEAHAVDRVFQASILSAV